MAKESSKTKDDEVNRESNMQKMYIANSDKPVAFGSLDAIMAVSYRINFNSVCAKFATTVSDVRIL